MRSQMSHLPFRRTALSLSLLCLGLQTAAAQAPGGFVEQAGEGRVQNLLSRSTIQSFLPAKGPFTFPAPWNTQAVRLTNADDCKGGNCVQAVGYSYWNHTNCHVGFDTMLIMVGLSKSQGGGGPTLFEYHKTTGEARNLGPLFPSSSSYSTHSGEGWYFSRSQPTKLYINNTSTP